MIASFSTSDKFFFSAQNKGIGPVFVDQISNSLCLQAKFIFKIHGDNWNWCARGKFQIFFVVNWNFCLLIFSNNKKAFASFLTIFQYFYASELINMYINKNKNLFACRMIPFKYNESRDRCHFHNEFFHFIFICNNRIDPKHQAHQSFWCGVWKGRKWKKKTCKRSSSMKTNESKVLFSAMKIAK